MTQDALPLSTMKVAAALFIIFIGMYFPLMSSIPLTIDAETMVWVTDFNGWIVQGRWGAYLVAQYLVPQAVVPYYPFALMGGGFSVGYCFIIAASGREPRAAEFFAFPLFCAFPTWLMLADFASNLPATAAAILASSLGVWLIFLSTEKLPMRVVRSAAATLLLAFAVACYQSFVFVFFGLCTTVLLLRVIDRPFVYQAVAWQCAQVVGVTIGGVLAYWLIQRGFLYAHELEIGYVDGFLRLDLLAVDPLAMLLGSGTTALRATGGEYWAALLLVPIALASLLIGRKLSPCARASSVALFAALVVSPFLLLPLTSGVLPERSLLGAGVLVWGAAMIGLLSRKRWLAYTTMAVVALATVQILGFSSRVEANKQLVARHDLLVASAIHERAIRLSPVYPIKVDFFGGFGFHERYPVSGYSTAGASFFEWGGGTPGRILNYMRLIGFGDLVGLPTQQRRDLMLEYESMPVWPAAGAVKLVGDVVLVKLGSLPGLY